MKVVFYDKDGKMKKSPSTGDKIGLGLVAGAGAYGYLKHKSMKNSGSKGVNYTVGGNSKKPKGLKAPTAKTAEKVTDRALKRFNPGGVRGGTSEAAGQAFTRSARAFERRFPQERAASIAKRQARVDRMFKTMGNIAKGFSMGAKIARSVTPAAVVSTVMSPTELGDATMDGKKYTNYKMTLNK